MQDLDDFARAAQRWLENNLAPSDSHAFTGTFHSDGEAERLAHARTLQRKLFDAGFAGLCFPKEYGGQGLPPAYQSRFNQLCAGYEMPIVFNVPTLGICAATLLECGTEEQKRRHLPAILRGDELWIQFLSEPSGGSDLAASRTTAVRDGDTYVVNGSKIWSTRAGHCDFGLCLVRTDWSVPKHAGLTVLIVKIGQPGMTVRPITMSNGSQEFYEEFFVDMRVPVSDRVGDENDGWRVIQNLLVHERTAGGGGSSYTSGVGSAGGGWHGVDHDLARLARQTGQLQDKHVSELVGEAYVLGTVQDALVERLSAAMRTGTTDPAAGAMLKIYGGEYGIRRATIARDISGSNISAWTNSDIGAGPSEHFLMRQTYTIGGGSIEMARNVVSERFLGMPRALAGDRGAPFADVPSGNAKPRRKQ